MRFSLSVSHSCLVICKSAKPAKKWYEMHMCISWLCPCKFKVVNSAFKTHASLIHLNKFASCYQTKSFIETPTKYFIKICRTFCWFDFASYGYLASYSIIKEAFKSCACQREWIKSHRSHSTINELKCLYSSCLVLSVCGHVLILFSVMKT